MLKPIYILCFFLGAMALHASPLPDRPPPGNSSDYLIHVWQTDNGLPQNWVSSLAQTPEGYLWVGTRYGGLARFDGVRFVSFTPQNTAELKDVQVEHLSVDSTGNLWIVMGNESISTLKNGTFTLQRNPRSEPRLRVQNVLDVSSNRILFSSEGSYLAQLSPAAATNGWQLLAPNPNPIPVPDTLCVDSNHVAWFLTPSHRVGVFRDQHFEFVQQFTQATSLTTDAERHIWLATPRRLLVWNGTSFENRTPVNGPQPNEILRIAFSGDGGLWVLEKDRLRKMVAGHWVAEADPEQFHTDLTGGEFTLYGDAQGNAWLMSYGHGLWHVKSNGQVRQLTEKEGLPSVSITCWFQDTEGNVWIGTAGGGIARIRESSFHVLGQAQGLTGKVVRSVCVDEQGGLWAGTMSKGLAHWENGQFVGIPLPSFPTPIESITVVPNKGNGVWIGSINHGLMQLQANTTNPPSIISSSEPNIRVLFTDSKERLWVGGLAGIFCYDKGDRKQFGSGEGFVDGQAVGAIAEDSVGKIWIGTGPGELWSYYNQKFTRYTPPAKWPSARVSALLTETNGVIWAGTLGGGLLRFQDGHFTRYRIQDGLPNNNITQLLDDQEGNIWAGTYAGIFRVAKTDLNTFALTGTGQLPCRVYGRFDGLPSLECSSGFQPSCWHAKDGRLWFSTANGLVSVNPQEVTGNRRSPLVVIEEIHVDGKRSNLPASLNPSHPLEIGPGQHYVQFRFTGLNFIAPDRVRFRVRLEGAETQWQDTEGQRTVGYGPLPPGSYQFHVRACNNDGVWSDEGTSLPFNVLPYFWETWWFKTSLGTFAFLTLGLTVALAQRRRYHLRLDRLQRQHAIEHERSRIAQDLHDDLGTSLTQISLLSALATRDQTPPAESRELLKEVRECSRKMVTALDEIVWAVNPKNDSLTELINYLGFFAETFFRSTPTRCRLDLPVHLPAHPLSAEVRHHLFLAFKEALNNAAKHSGASEVLLQVEIKERELIIHIKDNGHGFAKPDETSRRLGNGLTNMNKRMDQISGKADLLSILNQGTTVTLTLPL